MCIGDSSNDLLDRAFWGLHHLGICLLYETQNETLIRFSKTKEWVSKVSASGFLFKLNMDPFVIPLFSFFLFFLSLYRLEEGEGKKCFTVWIITSCKRKQRQKAPHLYSNKSVLHLYVDVISTLSNCIYILIMRLDRYDRLPCTAMNIVFLEKSQELQ